MDSSSGWAEKDDRNINAIRRFLKRKKLSAVIPFKTENIAYLTNYYDTIHMNIHWEESLTLLVIPLRKEPFMIGWPHHFAGPVKIGMKPWWLKELHPARDEKGNKIVDVREKLRKWASLMKEKELAKGRIGIDKWLPSVVLEEMRSVLPQAEFVIANDIFSQLRFVKTHRELKLLKMSYHANKRAMEGYMDILRSGGTQWKARIKRAQIALDYGAQWIPGANRMGWTGANDDTFDWWDPQVRNRWEKERDIQKKPGKLDFLQTDTASVYQGYYCDSSWREFFFEEPSPQDRIGPQNEWEGPFFSSEITYAEALEDFKMLRQAQKMILQGVKTGMSPQEAWQKVRNTLKDRKDISDLIKYFWIHSVGLELHEEPIIEFFGVTPSKGGPKFQLNSMVNSEVASRHWHIEEPFVLTKDGWVNLVPLRGLTRLDPF